MTMLRFILLALATLAVTTANGQTTYRWIDKTTGKTVFSDQPPPPGARLVGTKADSKAGGDDNPMSFATRQAAEKYPVTLYTTAGCVNECKQARDLLNQRGVPFTEKLVGTPEEQAELNKRLGSEGLFPTLFVGTQSVKGIEAGAWNNLLDLAGYPKTAAYGAKPSGAFAK